MMLAHRAGTDRPVNRWRAVAAASVLGVATCVLATSAQAVTNDLTLTFRYVYDPVTGPITGDVGSFTIGTLPAFATSTQGLGSASWSASESNVPGAPYLGVHAFAFDFSTAAPTTPVPGGSVGLVKGPTTVDFLTMHLTSDLFPEIIFESTATGLEAGAAYTYFGIAVRGPDGFQRIVSCLTDDPHQPCEAFGWDSVSQFGDTLSGLASLPRIDGDYTFTIAATQVRAQVIPEPATWALMLAGFGLLGTALRSHAARRRCAGP